MPDTPTGRTGSSSSEVPILTAPQRLDKWLWFARVVKTRTLAATLVTDGKVRVNRARVSKPAFTIKVDDVITVAAHRHVKVLKVVSTGERRGPAEMARQLYVDLTPARDAESAAGATGNEQHAAAPARDKGSGRPTKRERRKLDASRGRLTSEE